MAGRAPKSRPVQCSRYHALESDAGLSYAQERSQSNESFEALLSRRASKSSRCNKCNSALTQYRHRSSSFHFFRRISFLKNLKYPSVSKTACRVTVASMAVLFVFKAQISKLWNFYNSRPTIIFSFTLLVRVTSLFYVMNLRLGTLGFIPASLKATYIRSHTREVDA